MVYSWCLIGVLYQAKQQECSDSFIDAVFTRKNERKSKFGRLIVLIIEDLSRSIGLDAYKICPAIACKASVLAEQRHVLIIPRCVESPGREYLQGFLPAEIEDCGRLYSAKFDGKPGQVMAQYSPKIRN